MTNARHWHHTHSTHLLQKAANNRVTGSSCTWHMGADTVANSHACNRTHRTSDSQPQPPYTLLGCWSVTGDANTVMLMRPANTPESQQQLQVALEWGLYSFLDAMLNTSQAVKRKNVQCLHISTHETYAALSRQYASEEAPRPQPACSMCAAEHPPP
jgi:hypothetical protein